MAHKYDVCEHDWNNEMRGAPPPPGLLLSLGDGSAVVLPEKVIEGIAERIAGKMLQRRAIQFEDQSFSAARIVREILGSPEAIKEEIAHAERQNQQAQEARDAGPDRRQP